MVKTYEPFERGPHPVGVTLVNIQGSISFPENSEAGIWSANDTALTPSNRRSLTACPRSFRYWACH